jgi:hypothetical protein
MEQQDHELVVGLAARYGDPRPGEQPDEDERMAGQSERNAHGVSEPYLEPRPSYLQCKAHMLVIRQANNGIEWS